MPAALAPPAPLAAEVGACPASAASAAVRQLTGISLAAFEAMIALAGGRGALAGTTTEALKRTVVLPRTREAAYSAADWLVREGTVPADAVGAATAFVSHAYDYEFVKVVDALVAWEKRQREAGAVGPFFYYFDLLVVNQHGQRGVVRSRCATSSGAACAAPGARCSSWTGPRPWR